jgi:allantoate deiminase
MTSRAQRAVDACREIARFSENPDQLTRTFLSFPTHGVHLLLSAWMERLGMEWRIDAAGNLRGIYRGDGAELPLLLLGSHIDTVPNAGAFDGVLGVVLALVLMEELEGRQLSYDLEVVAFSEEEGVRFGVPFIGSRALIGDLDHDLLNTRDRDGKTVREAIESYGLPLAELPGAVIGGREFGYVEIHIEQGPVLEDLGCGLGIVDAIAGQSRYDVTFHGSANHAGTTPMRLRRDALAGAAEWIAAVERTAHSMDGLVATVGRADVVAGAANVVPGEVRLSLDVRHGDDSARTFAVDRLIEEAGSIAARRGLGVKMTLQFEAEATPMDRRLSDALEAAAAATGSRAHRMVSGAGHDAMVLAKRVPAAMLFLRSPAGVSHHPDEAVLVKDVEAALEAGLYFLEHLDPIPIQAPS